MGSKERLTLSQLKRQCQCINGHLFDYRDRIRISGEDEKYYAPCQGRCPRCGTTEFSFTYQGRADKILYPIKWNFIGADWNLNGRREY